MSQIGSGCEWRTTHRMETRLTTLLVRNGRVERVTREREFPKIGKGSLLVQIQPCQQHISQQRQYAIRKAGQRTCLIRCTQFRGKTKRSAKEMQIIEPNTFICGDCKDTLEHIPDKSIDVILTDPPYGVGLNYNTHIDSIDELEKIISLLPEFIRVSKLVVLTPGVKNMFRWPEPSHMGVYYYPSSPCFSNFGTCLYQPIYYYGKDPFIGKLLPDSFLSNECAEKNINHPCPKPINQWLWLLQRVSKHDDLVLDPFCGSGTTALACHKTGRRFICIDKDPDYIAIAKRRYAELIAQGDLFGSAPEQRQPQNSVQQIKVAMPLAMLLRKCVRES